MKTRLVKWLACPECLGDIRLEAIEQDRSAEVYTGLLLCDACRFIYPVYDGVPRMLPYFLDDYNKFIQNNRVVIEKTVATPFRPVLLLKEKKRRSAHSARNGPSATTAVFYGTIPMSNCSSFSYGKSTWNPRN